MVRFTVNRSPRDSRRLYPDPTGVQGAVGPLRVYWLEVNGTTPARQEYEKYKVKPRLAAALTNIDTLLAAKIRVPQSKMETVSKSGIRLWEIKVPPRGRQIFRFFAYQENDWDLFVAYVVMKKSQGLREGWKELAASRVKHALEEGGPL